MGLLDPSFPNLGKNEFSWERGLYQFLSIPIIYHHTKNQKKLELEKSSELTDGRADTNRQADRQTDNGDFIKPSIGRGPINQISIQVLSKYLSLHKHKHHSTEVYSESCQTSKMERFGKIIHSFQSMIILAKHSILFVWQGSEYALLYEKFLTDIHNVILVIILLPVG